MLTHAENLSNKQFVAIVANIHQDTKRLKLARELATLEETAGDEEGEDDSEEDSKEEKPTGGVTPKGDDKEKEESKEAEAKAPTESSKEGDHSTREPVAKLSGNDS